MNKIKKQKSGAFLVGLGIFLSRILGLVREKVFAHYFGNSVVADAFKAALRIPNFLQNLLGEGVLSASFIPTYSKLLISKNPKEAQILASSVLNVLLLIVSLLVLAGLYGAEHLVQLIAPGFTESTQHLCIQMVRIFFPATGILVLSAWCLGILNSHKKFFLPYVAPVLWNVAIILFIIFAPTRELTALSLWAAWGMFAGSCLQFLVQVPQAFKLLGNYSNKISFKNKNFQQVLSNFFPAVAGRGVVQLSAYIDNVLASFLAIGAVSGLSYAQTLYLLPVSLFGMSISAAELPHLSQVSLEKNSDSYKKLKERVQKSLALLLFYIIPSTFVFCILGDLVVSFVYQGGHFNQDNTIYVWKILATLSIGLIPSTMSRIYSSAFYALQDTKTPLKVSSVRLVTSLCFALLTFKKYGILGIAFANALGAWIEFFMLSRSFKKLTGDWNMNRTYLSKITLCGILSAGIIFLSKNSFLKNLNLSAIPSLILLGIWGVCFLSISLALKLEPAQNLLKKILRK